MFAKALVLATIAATTQLAYGQQEFKLRERPTTRQLKRVPEGPADYGWFKEKNAAYNDKSAAEKIDDLWEMLMTDVTDANDQEP